VQKNYFSPYDYSLKKMIEEEKIKVNWPSAVEGVLEHPDLGSIYYWTGEQKDRIVLRFRYEGQSDGESEKIFFINLVQDDWILSHISTFQYTDSKLKLVKDQSFKELKELEKKYKSIIEIFLKSRKNKNFF